MEVMRKYFLDENIPLIDDQVMWLDVSWPWDKNTTKMSA